MEIDIYLKVRIEGEREREREREREPVSLGSEVIQASYSARLLMTIIMIVYE